MTKRETDAMDERATWDRPDFADPRFSVEHVREVGTCRHEGCDRGIVYLVDYTMSRDGWRYEYDCGYCADHLPPQASALLEAQDD